MHCDNSRGVAYSESSYIRSARIGIVSTSSQPFLLLLHAEGKGLSIRLLITPIHRSSPHPPIQRTPNTPATLLEIPLAPAKTPQLRLPVHWAKKEPPPSSPPMVVSHIQFWGCFAAKLAVPARAAVANVGERSCSSADGDGRTVRLLVKRGIIVRSSDWR